MILARTFLGIMLERIASATVDGGVGNDTADSRAAAVLRDSRDHAVRRAGDSTAAHQTTGHSTIGGSAVLLETATPLETTTALEMAAGGREVQQAVSPPVPTSALGC